MTKIGHTGVMPAQAGIQKKGLGMTCRVQSLVSKGVQRLLSQ